MMELLQYKANLFDEYADESEMDNRAKELLDNKKMTELVHNELERYQSNNAPKKTNEETKKTISLK
jgi:hypothetical protein